MKRIEIFQKIGLRLNTLSPRLLLSIYLLLFIAVAVSIAAVQPLTNEPPFYPNPPDEGARIQVPRFISEHGHLPDGFDKKMRSSAGIYAFQPGLPYILMGLLMRLMSLFGITGWGLVVTARLVNVAIGAVNAYMLYRLGKRIFPKSNAAWVFAIGCTFHPQHLFLHTYVNTESMCMLSIVLMGYALISIYQDGLTYKRCILLSVGQIFCALTYYNAYGFLLCSVILFILTFVHKDNCGRPYIVWKEFKKYALLTFSITIIGAGWWFIRNAILLDGDIIGVSTRSRVIRESGYIWLSPFQQGQNIIEMLQGCYRGLYVSFVATYGSMSISASEEFYNCYDCFFLIGIISCAVKGIIYFRKVSIHKLIFHLITICAIIITFGLWLYYCYVIDYQPQGRYIMPIVVPLYWYTVSGYVFLGETIKKLRKVKIDYFIYVYQITCLLLISLSLYFIYSVAYPVFFKSVEKITKNTLTNVEIIKQECTGYIDIVSKCRKYRCVQGWIVHSLKQITDGVVAFTDELDTGNIQYYEAFSVKRPDVAIHFKRRRLRHSGYLVVLPSDGVYRIGYKFKNSFYACNNLQVEKSSSEQK